MENVKMDLEQKQDGWGWGPGLDPFLPSPLPGKEETPFGLFPSPTTRAPSSGACASLAAIDGGASGRDGGGVRHVGDGSGGGGSVKERTMKGHGNCTGNGHYFYLRTWIFPPTPPRIR
ncbi:hypothetical protein NL676_023868 [Syzygium grande]|nr:hypothetical protein NL676_023868 [Syzygium grande]